MRTLSRTLNTEKLGNNVLFGVNAVLCFFKKAYMTPTLSGIYSAKVLAVVNTLFTQKAGAPPKRKHLKTMLCC